MINTGVFDTYANLDGRKILRVGFGYGGFWHSSGGCVVIGCESSQWGKNDSWVRDTIITMETDFSGSSVLLYY